MTKELRTVAEQKAHAENNELHVKALHEHSAANPSTCTCGSTAMRAAGIQCPVHP